MQDCGESTVAACSLGQIGGKQDRATEACLKHAAGSDGEADSQDGLKCEQLPKVTVVIPTYNRAHLLERAIDSVLGQTCQDFELFIVDDGPSDGTRQLVEKKRANMAQPLRYWHRPHAGVSAARNWGIQRARGEWVAFLDSDDQWLPWRLERQFELLQCNPHLKLIHGEEIWIRRGQRVNPKKIHQKFGGDIFEKCLPRCLISPSATLIKRELLREVGLFDEEFVVCEDYDLWLKITSLYPVGFVDEPIIVKYGGHADQLSSRYKGMDYWRVRALERILHIRRFSPGRRQRVASEMIKKANILKKGLIKHGNFKHLAYVEGILHRFGGRE